MDPLLRVRTSVDGWGAGLGEKRGKEEPTRVDGLGVMEILRLGLGQRKGTQGRSMEDNNGL